MNYPTETAVNQAMLITALSGTFVVMLGRVLVHTRVASLRFTSHLSDAIAIAVTSVVKVMDDFVPGVSNLIEGFSLWFLTLICCRSAEEKVIGGYN